MSARRARRGNADITVSQDPSVSASTDYGGLVSGISALLEQARRTAARSINSLLTATYWEIGRRIVEYEQGGKARAEYGEHLLARLSKDLTSACGRGFSKRNLEQMRAFYLGWEIAQTASAQFEARAVLPTAPADEGGMPQQMPVAESTPSPVPVHQEHFQTDHLTRGTPATVFPLSWSQYVRLMSVQNPWARAFYESEAIRGAWSVRQLDRQISTQFYERALQSRQPRALLARGQTPRPEDILPVEAEIRDPYLLEFLNLQDEYAEADLEEALIRHLEWFLLEMGAGFTFVARQKRIRIGDSWYRIDLLLYHRGLRCLVVIDLKTGTFTHADAGQMNLYLNYAREQLILPGEADPVGIILCSDKDDAVVKYATGGIQTRVFASKYLINLPDEETLRREIVTTRRAIRARWREEKTDG